MKKLFWTVATLYAVTWVTHLVLGTAFLRGFFGDGALAFIINLSDSYVFNHDSHWVHLFSVGFPRDFQLLLNALGLQAALGLGITNPAVLKYIFVFWQFALPGFLYLLIFAVLARTRQLPWAIFPLISWAVASVPVDWNAVNSTRWAIPIFWMYFLLVLLAERRVRPAPLAAVLAIGVTMLGGLYESIVLQCALCLVVGAVLWVREKNRTPFLYALAGLPGAYRAIYAFMTVGHIAPNGFHNFIILQVFSEPYLLFLVLALCLIVALWLTSRISLIPFCVMLTVLAALGALVLSDPSFSVWAQEEMRYDYVMLSLALMAWAGILRIFKKSPLVSALPISIVALLTGAILWTVQAEQTLGWQSCMAQYERGKGDSPLIIDRWMTPLFTPSTAINAIDRGPYGECTWDWTQPWTDMLLAKDGRISQWTLFTFWQDFRFIKKDGSVYLHTNNWTLTSPSMHPSEADLPLKTGLYDLTQLYARLGDGPIAERAHCMPAEQSGPYWHDHLMALDDAARAMMFVCPRSATPGMTESPP